MIVGNFHLVMQGEAMFEFTSDGRVLNLTLNQLNALVASGEFRSLSLKFTPVDLANSVLLQISNFQSSQVCMLAYILCIIIFFLFHYHWKNY